MIHKKYHLIVTDHNYVLNTERNTTHKSGTKTLACLFKNCEHFDNQKLKAVVFASLMSTLQNGQLFEIFNTFKLFKQTHIFFFIKCQMINRPCNVCSSIKLQLYQALIKVRLINAALSHVYQQLQNK